MPIIPDFLPNVILPLWRELLTWFSRQVYERTLRPTDFLVRLAEELDFAPLEQACAGYHHTAGPGAVPTHTVARLVRALVLKYVKDLSLRALEEDIRTNLVSKWFVGYALFERGPDHTTLERFEQWVIEHHSRLFFDEVLRQIDQAFPAERRKPQLGDTYALRANAAQESLITLLRHTCRSLLATLAAAAPATHDQLSRRLDHTALFGAEDEIKAYRLDPAQRTSRRHTVACAAAHCADLVRAALAARHQSGQPAAPAVSAWLTILDKILADEGWR